MKKILLLSVILVQAALLLAVFDDYIPSARARAMGGAYTGVADDVNAIFFNPAGLSETEYEVQYGFANLYGQRFSQIQTAAIGFKLPKKIGTLAFGTRMFNVDFADVNLMSEQIWSASHGFVLQEDIHSKISVGYTANYYLLSFDGEKTDDAFGFDLGATALLHGRTKLGFSVTNFNQAVMGDTNQHNLPSKLALGISYIPYDGVTTTIELKKDFAQETEFMGGVEARLFEPLFIRFGVHQNPAAWNAGIGLDIEGIVIDLSYTTHAVLNGTLYGNLGYKF
ncbi:MAG: hypothetical protein Q8M98_03550 [Candidatus Cloacimonadaceae bacterium]|nr:hypothetical protein [Candidatus Cloacimonadaceae bacterium]MDP3113831.1 hypothetical protein [Candidatus Cloacimonadaceae bacterium]